ncbi:MAG: hypothetical protein Q8885_00110, partial [Candidatus Phytoplasma stylosanthis]|nr:hypothetical protein [Candidatus Phytoplasma stylosanthis]
CLFLLFLSIYSFFGGLIVSKETPFSNIYFYFTYQTIITILLVLISFFFKFKNRKIYSIFIFLTVVNSLLTFLVYNLILFPIWQKEKNIFLIFLEKYRESDKKWENILLEKNFFSILQHFFLPICFFLFFFFFIPFSLKKIRYYFYTFLHPIIYLSIFFLIHSFDILGKNKNCSNNIFNEKEECWLPYPNIQCIYHGKVFFNVDVKELTNTNLFFLNFLVFSRIIILTFFFSFLFILIFEFKKRFIKDNVIKI